MQAIHICMIKIALHKWRDIIAERRIFAYEFCSKSICQSQKLDSHGLRARQRKLPEKCHKLNLWSGFSQFKINLNNGKIVRSAISRS